MNLPRTWAWNPRGVPEGTVLVLAGGVLLGWFLLQSWVLGCALLAAVIIVGIAARSVTASWFFLFFFMLFFSNYFYPPKSTIFFWGLACLFISSAVAHRLISGRPLVMGDRLWRTALLAWFSWGIVSALFSPDVGWSLKEIGRYGILLLALLAYLQWFTDEMALRRVLRILWVGLNAYAVLLMAKILLADHRLGMVLGGHWHSHAESGSYYAMFLPLFVSLLGHLRGEHWVKGLGVLTFVAAAALSQSASALAAIVVGVVVVAACQAPRSAQRIALWGICVATGFWILGGLYVRDFGEVLLSQLSGRERVWAAALRAMMSNPVVGIGPGMWSQWFGANCYQVDFIFYDFDDNIFVFDPATLRGQAHNLFLTKGAEMGIPSLLLLLAVFASWYHKVIGIFRDLPDGWRRDLVRGCLASFLGLTVFSLFENGPIIGVAREGELLFVTMIMAIPFVVETWPCEPRKGRGV